jgi:hypothetical protein
LKRALVEIGEDPVRAYALAITAKKYDLEIRI